MHNIVTNTQNIKAYNVLVISHHPLISLLLPLHNYYQLSTILPRQFLYTYKNNTNLYSYSMGASLLHKVAHYSRCPTSCFFTL